jgi:stage III sporulation protein AE
MDEISIETVSYITEEEANGEKGIFFPEKLYHILSDATTKGIKSVLKGLSLLLALIVISSLFKTTKSLANNSALNNAYDYFTVLLISASAYSMTAEVFTTSKKALDGLTSYFAALMPIMTTLQLSGGNTAVASSSASTLLLFISSVEIISDKVLLSLLGIGFALAIISALPSSVNLKSVSSLIKNSVSVILAFLFSMFGFVMIFQTAVSAAADNAAIRSLKFASGVFIPVIGNMLGENIKSVITAVGTVKATVGAIGAVAVFSIILPPIVYTVLYKLSILLCAIFSKMLGLDKESDFLYEINSLFNVLVAIMCGTGMLFIISVAVFAKTGVNA